MNLASRTVNSKLQDIRVLVLDVDGVLTDGRIHYGGAGEMIKSFNAKDGLGIKMLQFVGIGVAVITARKSDALARRMYDLGIEHFFPGRPDKTAAVDELTQQLGVTLNALAYVGDDVLDLPVLRRVGLSIAVADAHAVVRDAVSWVTQAKGGDGAVREVSDLLLGRERPLVQVYDEYLQSLEAGSAGE